jgi:hypothetical protein
MRDYTTLGSGKATKVLAVAPYCDARTVTTASHAAAKAVASALGRTDRRLPAALFGLAVALDGTPVEARRHLLATFDAELSGAAGLRGDLWSAAEDLVVAVADAVAGEPAAVVAAVRAELAEHLEGFDGVLVPARAIAYADKVSAANLVVSGALGWLGDSFWDYLLGPHGDLGVGEDDPMFPLGGPAATSIELYAVLMELVEVEPVSLDFTDFSVAEVLAHAGDHSIPELLVRADHLLAWVEVARPADAARVRELLAPSS